MTSTKDPIMDLGGDLTTRELQNGDVDENALETKALSSGNRLNHASRAFEEEYINWENKINKEFVDFLAHIRDFVTEKEGQLKEYQIDLCHRERSLQNNEDYFKERMATLKKAEEEFQHKVERLNLQIQDRMQRLRTLESQKSNRLSYNNHEIGVQTVLCGVNTVLHSSHGAHTTVNMAPEDGNYMFMGPTNGTSNYDHGMDSVVIVNGEQTNGDSGFNTPDQDDKSPVYRYENIPPTLSRRLDSKPHETAHKEQSSKSYNGERAMLVKSPKGVETYTTNGQEYKNLHTAVSRSRSVPPEDHHFKSRGRSLSPDVNRASSVPPEPPLDSNPLPRRSLAELNQQFRNRPASFAEGQLSPHTSRSRIASFGVTSVNGQSTHGEDLCAQHSDVTKSSSSRAAAARVLRHNKTAEDGKTNQPAGPSHFMAGQQSIGEEEVETLGDLHTNPANQSPPISTNIKPTNSSSVTNLDDPRLRESILTKSKQASFNMNDAIAQYKAKSENHLQHDLSDTSSSSRGMNSPNGGVANWENETAPGYNHNANNITTQYGATNTKIYPPGSDLRAPHVTQDTNTVSRIKSRLPGRRSEPEDLRQKAHKLKSSIPFSDSNLHSHAPGVPNEPGESQSSPKRTTSPKPILKNHMKPVESYHNTYSNAQGYGESKLQRPQRRYEAPPPPIRRYPSEVDNHKERSSTKSGSNSDLAQNPTKYNSGHPRTDSENVHAHNQNTRSDSPEMTSTQRDNQPIENNAFNNIENSHLGTDNNDAKYGPQGNTAGNSSIPMSSGGTMMYRSSQLQHPIMAGRVGLRDKSSWAIKKKREQPRSADNAETGGENTQARRIPLPGSYQRSDTRPENAERNPSYPTKRLSSTEAPRRIPSPERLRSPGHTRRSQSSDGYLEGANICQQYGDQNSDVNIRAHYSEADSNIRGRYAGNALGTTNQTMQFTGNNNQYSVNTSAHYGTMNAADGTTTTTTRHSAHMKHFDNEIIEKCSDSDSELYSSSKKETKKKLGLKLKLRGLYRGGASKSHSKLNQHSGDVQNSGQTPNSPSNEDTVSPKHKSKLPYTNNNYIKANGRSDYTT